MPFLLGNLYHPLSKTHCIHLAIVATWPLSVCVSYAMNTPSVCQELEGQANKSPPGMPRISTLQERRDFNSNAKGNGFLVEDKNQLVSTDYSIP